MIENEALRPEFDRIQGRALLVGAVGLAASLLGALLSGREFLKAYLIGYLLWLGISLGSVAIPMLHQLTGGLWGFAIRRPLEAGAMTLPVMALLFIPLAIGVRVLYPWADPDASGLSEAIRGAILHKQRYLNVGFFLARAVGYFVLWVGFAYLLCRWSRQQDRTDDPSPTLRLRTLSGPGLGVFFLTTTFAMIDWVMSLEPAWYSTIFSAMMIVGQGMTTFAFMIAAAGWLSRRGQLREVATPTSFNDLGNLLLAFVMLWAYMAFSQFLIIWSGNLPEEIPWYLKRMRGGWQWLALALILFHFFLPFFVLLFRDVKRTVGTIMVVAVALVVVHVFDLFWLIAPAIRPRESYGYLLDLLLALAATVGIGGIWLYAFIRDLKAHPLVPYNDPALALALAHHGGPEGHGGGH